MTFRFKRAREANEHPEVSTVSAHGRGCLGCQTWDKDVMVSFGTRYDNGIQHHDFFLTTEQAHRLLGEIDRAIRVNLAEGVRGATPERDPRIDPRPGDVLRWALGGVYRVCIVSAVTDTGVETAFAVPAVVVACETLDLGSWPDWSSVDGGIDGVQVLYRAEVADG